MININPVFETETGKLVVDSFCLESHLFATPIFYFHVMKLNNFFVFRIWKLLNFRKQKSFPNISHEVRLQEVKLYLDFDLHFIYFSPYKIVS